MKGKAVKDDTSEKLVDIVEIDRRHFLRLAGGTLIALSGFAFVGCGGSGGGNQGGIGLKTLRGAVLLAAPGNVGPLTTANVFSTNPVGSNMQFSQAVLGPNPSLAYVQDASGRVMFVGFLDPNSNSNALGPLSTAVALLYLALDGYSLPPQNSAAVLALIAKDPATIAFSQVISQRVAANPFALDSADSGITSGLLTAYTAIRAEGSRIPRMKPATPGSQLLINGTNPSSGFSVLQDPSTSGAIIGQNEFRRYSNLYVYETGTVDKSGNKTMLPVAQRVGNPIYVDTTLRLNLITSLQSIFSSTSPFSPVSTSSLPLPLLANTSQTLYDVVVIGSSSSGSDPAFFSEAIYANEVAAWRKDLQTFNFRSTFGDVLFGLLLNFLGVSSAASLPPTTVDQAILDLTSSVQSVDFKLAVAQAAKAANPELVIKVVSKIVSGTGTSYIDKVGIYGVANFLASAAGKQAINVARTRTLINLGFRVLGGIISGASIVLGVGDLAAVVHDLAASNSGDIWNVDVVASTLTLNPINPTASPGDTVSFSAKLPPGFVVPPNTSIIYDWSQNGALAVLSDGNGITGQGSIETASSTVNLITTPSQQAPISVSVSAYVLGPGGTKTLIDTASTTVKIGQKTSFPAIPVVFMMDTIAGNGTHVTIVVGFATFKPIPSAKAYGLQYTSAESTLFGTPSVDQAAIDKGGAKTVSDGGLWSDQSNRSNPAQQIFYNFPGTPCYSLGAAVGFASVGLNAGDLNGTTLADVAANLKSLISGMTVLVSY